MLVRRSKEDWLFARREAARTMCQRSELRGDGRVSGQWSVRHRTMSPGTLLALTTAFMLLCVQGSSGLLCYQCATTDEDNRCITDYWGFVNDSKGITQTYVKNCTATNPEWDRCMIETLEQNGGYTHFHRGCHDGKTFSEKFESDRFKDLYPSNYTTCAFVVTLTCYTFCNTDLCNGPQTPPNETNPCADYDYDEDYGTLPEGVFCGANSVHSVYLALVLLVSLAGSDVLSGLWKRLERLLQ